MVELISKVSKGSKMDQIYIPKQRLDLAIGSYVTIKPLETTPKEEIKPLFYNIKYIEPIKIRIVKEIFNIIEEFTKPDNIIIFGSFVEKGFNFNDIDVIIIKKDKIDLFQIEKTLKTRIGINFHLSSINNKSLIKGISTDPLFKSFLTKCISKKRFIYQVNPQINYKLLDLHLLKSKPLIDNFDVLTGNEKYKMARNLIAIAQFIEEKEVTKEKIDSVIKSVFNITIQEIKNNIMKKEFLIKYKKIYEKTQNKILEGIKNEQG